MPTYRLDIGYDGSGFHGYAMQKGFRTVQGVLEEALFRITGPVETAVAGRTDAGVHARGQVVSFVTDQELDVDQTARSVGKMVGEEIVVWDCRRVADDFNARFSATSRTYHYRVAGNRVLDPLVRHAVWHVPGELYLGRMQAAAQHFVGEHDFASFCRRAEGRPTVRTVVRADWTSGESAGDCLFEIQARSFCHQMVRSLVAVCVDVGRGRLQPDAIPGIIGSRDRNAAAGAAPPHGLVLWEVEY